MPAAINTIHIIFTVLAFGLLFGLGFAVAQKLVAWPADRVSGGALLVAIMILLIAWLV